MTRKDPAGETDRRAGGNPPRRSRRLPTPGLLVAIDVPGASSGHFVADALDINADGLGLVLPPEIPEGTSVELSFKLGDGLEFSRLPAVVRHQEGTSGGVRFGAWPESDRLRLLEYLVRRHEAPGDHPSSR